MSLLLTRIKRQPKLLRKLQWTLGLLLLPVVGLLFFATALVNLEIDYIPFEGEIAETITEQHKERIKQMVTMVGAIIDAAVPPQHAIIGSDLKPEMQEQIQRMIRAAKYDFPHGYFILFTADGTVLAQGIEPENVGMNRLLAKDADGVPYIQRLGEAASRGGDFVQYKWKKLAGEEVYLKIAYTKTLRGGQWWLGSGFYVDTITEKIQAQSHTIWRRVSIITTGLGIVLALSLLWVVYQANRVFVQTVAEPVARLVEGARRISTGEYGHRVEIDNNDELKVLADAFHCMGDNISLTISNLMTSREESSQRLEQIRAFHEREWTLVEKERRRIARELHDGIGHRLNALLEDLKSASIAEEDVKQRAWRLEQIQSIIDLTDELRAILGNLRPPFLDTLGLSTALRSHLEKQARSAKIAVGFHANESALSLPEEVENNVFRVVQEAMTNVVRHAGASRVDVWIHCNGEMLEVRMQDDGCGFDEDAVRSRNEGRAKFGLIGIEERVRSLGGTVQWVSDPKSRDPRRGTTVLVRIPLIHYPRQ